MADGNVTPRELLFSDKEKAHFRAMPIAQVIKHANEMLDGITEDWDRNYCLTYSIHQNLLPIIPDGESPEHVSMRLVEVLEERLTDTAQRRSLRIALEVLSESFNKEAAHA